MDKQIPDFTFLWIIRNHGIKIEALTQIRLIPIGILEKLFDKIVGNLLMVFS